MVLLNLDSNLIEHESFVANWEALIAICGEFLPSDKKGNPVKTGHFPEGRASYGHLNENINT